MYQASRSYFFLASIFICIFHSLDPLLVPLAVNKEIIICCLSANCVCVCAYVCPDLKHFTIIGYKSLLKDVEEEYLKASVPPSNCGWTCPLMSRRESRRPTKSETGGAQSEEGGRRRKSIEHEFVFIYSFVFVRSFILFICDLKFYFQPAFSASLLRFPLLSRIIQHNDLKNFQNRNACLLKLFPSFHIFHCKEVGTQIRTLNAMTGFFNSFPCSPSATFLGFRQWKLFIFFPLATPLWHGGSCCKGFLIVQGYKKTLPPDYVPVNVFPYTLIKKLAQQSQKNIAK